MFNDTRINVGKMREQISIVQPSTTQDAVGGTQLGGGTVLTTCWAEITALSGRDALAAQQYAELVTHQVVIRYLPGVASRQVVMFGARQFEIQAVINPDERTKKLILLCVEVNNNAS
jgi:SPP1 family predicted phage head-tail adaptor